MQIRQFGYSADNFSYLVYGRSAALAIDGGAVQEIMAFLKRRELTLQYVTNTHTHADHTRGTRELVRQSGAEYLDPREFEDNASLPIENETVKVYLTPGHTLDSVTFHVQHFLITGDTLFNGTVGNCFSGDLKSFYRSIKRLLALADESVVYAGHDYVRDSLAFARKIEPHNRAISAYAARYNRAHVFSTLAEEKRVNPYLRFNEESIVAFLKARGLPVATEYERWESLMSIE